MDVSFALKTFAAAIAIVASTGCGTSRDSILFARGSPYRIRLLDAYTGHPISNLAIKLLAQRAVVCSAAHCPVDSLTWTGRSDADGRIELPKSAIGFNATAAADAYEADLLDNATHAGGSEWVLELTASDSAASDPYPIKLFDDESAKPLTNTPGKFTFTHQGEHQIAFTTNALGYLFIPAQIAAIGKHSFVKVQHFDVGFVDFGDRHNIYIRATPGKFDHDR